MHLASDDKFRGEYSNNAGPTIEGPERVSGTTEHAFNPEEVAIILELLGFTATGTSFALNDSALPQRYMTIDREEKVHTFSGMMLASALAAMLGRYAVALDFELAWRTRNDRERRNVPVDRPDGNRADGAYIMRPLRSSVSGSRVVDDVTINIDNMVEHRCFNADFYTPERHGRNVSASFSVPYAGNTDMLQGLGCRSVRPYHLDASKLFERVDVRKLASAPGSSLETEGSETDVIVRRRRPENRIDERTRNRSRLDAVAGRRQRPRNGRATVWFWFLNFTGGQIE